MRDGTPLLPGQCTSNAGERINIVKSVSNIQRLRADSGREGQTVFSLLQTLVGLDDSPVLILFVQKQNSQRTFIRQTGGSTSNER